MTRGLTSRVAGLEAVLKSFAQPATDQEEAYCPKVLDDGITSWTLNIGDMCNAYTELEKN